MESICGSMAVGEGFEQYLEAIYHLEEVDRESSTSALADWLGVRMASVTGMLKRLEAAGLVEYAAYQPATLTPAGRAVALRIVRRHRLWENFLTEKLHVPWYQVYTEACDLEHATSLSVELALDRYLEYPKVCPHGFPIPDTEGGFAEVRALPLGSLAIGEAGIVRRITERQVELLQYLAEKGLHPGAEIRVTDVAPFEGPVTVEIQGAGNLSVAPHIAGLILVEKT